MQVLNFIREYWVLITFFLGELGVLFVFAKSILNGTKCSLRNDMLEIWDKCKETKQITSYQLQAFNYSYELYKKLKGNSFIDEIMEEIKEFKIVN